MHLNFQKIQLSLVVTGLVTLSSCKSRNNRSAVNEYPADEITEKSDYLRCIWNDKSWTDESAGLMVMKTVSGKMIMERTVPKLAKKTFEFNRLVMNGNAIIYSYKESRTGAIAVSPSKPFSKEGFPANTFESSWMNDLNDAPSWYCNLSDKAIKDATDIGADFPSSEKPSNTGFGACALTEVGTDKVLSFANGKRLCVDKAAKDDCTEEKHNPKLFQDPLPKSYNVKFYDGKKCSSLKSHQ